MKRSVIPSLIKTLDSKIILLSGPRDVGKLELSKGISTDHQILSYDTDQERESIHTHQWDHHKDLLILDEIQKMKGWKAWAQDSFGSNIKQRVLMTGSATHKSTKTNNHPLNGNFAHFRLHPLTIDEVKRQCKPEIAIERIIRYGGFPEPFLRGNEVFAKHWRRKHLHKILRGDLLDLHHVKNVKAIEHLVVLLKSRVGSSISYASLARDLRVSIPTVKHWLNILESLFVIFPIRPWHRHIPRAILKEPKYYFYDVGALHDNIGQRIENAVACGLLKALHQHEDLTGDKVDLHYIRNKQGQEVDFLVAINNEPIFMAEVKTGNNHFSPHLALYQKHLDNIPAYHVVLNLKHSKTLPNLTMLSAAQFLADIPLP